MSCLLAGIAFARQLKLRRGKQDCLRLLNRIDKLVEFVGCREKIPPNKDRQPSIEKL